MTGSDGLNAQVSPGENVFSMDTPDEFSFSEACALQQAHFHHGQRIAFDDYRFFEQMRVRIPSLPGEPTGGGAGPLFAGTITGIERVVQGGKETVRYHCSGLLQETANFMVTDGYYGINTGRIPRLVFNADEDDPDFAYNARGPRATLHTILDWYEKAYLNKLSEPPDGDILVGLNHSMVPGSFVPWNEHVVPPKIVLEEVSWLDGLYLILRTAIPGIFIWHHYLEPAGGQGTADDVRFAFDMMDLSDPERYPLIVQRWRYKVESGRVLAHNVQSDSTGRYTAVVVCGRKLTTKPMVAKFDANVAGRTLWVEGPTTPEETHRYILYPAWGLTETERRFLEQRWSCTQAPGQSNTTATTEQVITGPSDSRQCNDLNPQGQPAGPRVTVASIKTRGSPYGRGWFDCGDVRVFERAGGQGRQWPAQGLPPARVVTNFESMINLTEVPPISSWNGALGHRIEITARPPSMGGSYFDVFHTYIVLDTKELDSAGGPWRFKPVVLNADDLVDNCCGVGYFVQDWMGLSTNPTYYMKPVSWTTAIDYRRLPGGSLVTVPVIRIGEAAIINEAHCATPGSALVNPKQEFRFCMPDTSAPQVQVRFPAVGYAGDENNQRPATPDPEQSTKEYTSTAYEELGTKEIYYVLEDSLTPEMVALLGVEGDAFRVGVRRHAQRVLKGLKDIKYNGSVTIRGFDFGWIMPLAVVGQQNLPLDVEANLSPVDFYIGGLMIAKNALHRRVRYNYEDGDGTTTVELSTDLERGTVEFERAVADLQTKQKAKAQERAMHKAQSVSRCDAGERLPAEPGQPGAPGGGGVPRGSGGFGGGWSGRNSSGLGSMGPVATGLGVSLSPKQLGALLGGMGDWMAGMQGSINQIIEALGAIAKKLWDIQQKMRREKGGAPPARMENLF